MFKKLGFHDKFHKGAEVWCIFYEPQRALFKSLNWETHFLIEKINTRQKLSQALLLATADIFPNHSLLCLPLSLSDKIYDFWKKLAQPSFRVFLPLNFDEKDLFRQWPHPSQHQNLSYQQLSYYKEK